MHGPDHCRAHGGLRRLRVHSDARLQPTWPHSPPQLSRPDVPRACVRLAGQTRWPVRSLMQSWATSSPSGRRGLVEWFDLEHRARIRLFRHPPLRRQQQTDRTRASTRRWNYASLPGCNSNHRASTHLRCLGGLGVCDASECPDRYTSIGRKRACRSRTRGKLASLQLLGSAIFGMAAAAYKEA